MTDGADAPVEGEPTDLPPPEPDPVDAAVESDEPIPSMDDVDAEPVTDPADDLESPEPVEIIETEANEPVEPVEPVESVDSVEPVESVESVDSVEPVVVPAGPPRLGPIVVHDRRRALLGVASAVALAVASVFGVRLIGMLTDDEAGDASPPVDGPVGELVPFVVALAEAPSSPGAPEVLAALNGGRHDIAVDTDVAALCATVALDEDLVLAGRWERNGEAVASTAASALSAPGFADCVTADGEPLPDGTYQFVVADDDDAVSAPGTVVLGAAAVAQRFVNQTDEALCALRLAPMRAGYFDIFDTSASPIEPGGSITLALADVRMRLEAVACADGEVVSRELVRPDADTVRNI